MVFRRFEDPDESFSVSADFFGADRLADHVKSVFEKGFSIGSGDELIRSHFENWHLRYLQ